METKCRQYLQLYSCLGANFFFGLIYFIIKCKTTFKKEEPKFKGIPLIIGVEKKKIVLLKLIF